jgi:Flp pilus assembly protein TadB
MNSGVALFLYLAITSIALFSFLAVAAWSGARMTERETYYKNETLKKIAESTGPGAEATIQYLRDQQMYHRRLELQKQRQGMQLGGLITAAVGIALMIFLKALVPHHPIYLAGVVPLLIGIALLIYVQLFAPKESETV